MAREYELQGLSKKEYLSIHKWLRGEYKGDNKCIVCGDDKLKIHFALIHGMKYERDFKNYHQLCGRCHGQYDAPIVAAKRGFTLRKPLIVIPVDRSTTKESLLKQHNN